MMNRIDISRSLIAILLLLAFVMPASIQVIHEFEDHEHVACTETKTHMHADTQDCDICNFQLATFSYDFPEPLDFSINTVPVIHDENIVSQAYSATQVSHKQLRAPPAYL